MGGVTPLAVSVDIMELRNRGVKIYTCNGKIYGISNCNLVLERNEDGSESVSCNICRKSVSKDKYKGPLGKVPLSPSLTSLALQNSTEPASG
jgi:hypothetical protein